MSARSLYSTLQAFVVLRMVSIPAWLAVFSGSRFRILTMNLLSGVVIGL